MDEIPKRISCLTPFWRGTFLETVGEKKRCVVFIILKLIVL